MISIFLTCWSSTHFYSTNLVLWAYSTSLFFYHLSIKNYNRYRHMIVLSITLKLCSMRNFILFYGNIWDRVNILHSFFVHYLTALSDEIHIHVSIHERMVMKELSMIKSNFKWLYGREYEVLDVSSNGKSYVISKFFVTIY